MRLEVDLRGHREAIRELRRTGSVLRRAVSSAIASTAAELEGGIKLEIQQGQKTGSVYTRRSVTHQASAPGEAPASDTGTLIGSIYHEAENDLRYAVGSRADYAPWLEFGTRKMGARPFFRPALEKIRPSFVRNVTDAIRRRAR